MELLNRLRILVDEYISKSNDEKYLIIKEMLKDDKCFFSISSSTALAILCDLGFEDEEAQRVYEELVSVENYKKLFERILVK